MKFLPIAFICMIIFAGCASADIEQKPQSNASEVKSKKVSEFAFDPKQLSGNWAESYNNKTACSIDNLHFKMQIDPKAKSLNILLDRMWSLANGEQTDHYSATIVSATERTLVIRYDNETRVREDGSLVEWELSMVAPTVYRWRETSWPEGKVNTVVGIKCSED